MKYTLVLLPLILTGCASSHKPPMVDGSKRVPINSTALDENLALRAELARSSTVLSGQKQPLTTFEQNSILTGKLALNEDLIKKRGLTFYTVVFVPKGFFDIKPTGGQIEQLRRHSQTDRGIKITSDSSILLERTKERLKEFGAQEKYIKTILDSNMKEFVEIIFE